MQINSQSAVERPQNTESDDLPLGFFHSDVTVAPKLGKYLFQKFTYNLLFFCNISENAHRSSFVRSILFTVRSIQHGGDPSHGQRSHTRNAIHIPNENRYASRNLHDTYASLSSSSSTTSSGNIYIISYSFNLKLIIIIIIISFNMDSSINFISRNCKKTK